MISNLGDFVFNRRPYNTRCLKLINTLKFHMVNIGWNKKKEKKGEVQSMHYKIQSIKFNPLTKTSVHCTVLPLLILHMMNQAHFVLILVHIFDPSVKSFLLFFTHGLNLILLYEFGPLTMSRLYLHWHFYLTRWKQFDFATTCISHRPLPEYTPD